jgi:hypothetical protein
VHAVVGDLEGIGRGAGGNQAAVYFATA